MRVIINIITDKMLAILINKKKITPKILPLLILSAYLFGILEYFRMILKCKNKLIENLIMYFSKFYFQSFNKRS